MSINFIHSRAHKIAQDLVNANKFISSPMCRWNLVTKIQDALAEFALKESDEMTKTVEKIIKEVKEIADNCLDNMEGEDAEGFIKWEAKYVIASEILEHIKRISLSDRGE